MKIGQTYSEDQKKTKIRKCLLTIYPNKEVLITAVRDKFDLIITYTLPNWNFDQITDEFYKVLKILFENRIFLYLIPDEWTARKSGLIEIISELLNLKVIDLFQIEADKLNQKIIGRICQVSTKIYLVDLLTLLKQKLDLTYLRYLGNLDSSIQKVAIIIKQELTPDLLKMAKLMNVDTIICTNFTYITEKIAEELEINLIDVSLHIANLGLLKLTQTLRMDHLDVEFAFINLKPFSGIFK